MAKKALSDHYDVIVIGGGPAGSTAATLVSQKGYRVLVLDREEFPRYRLGESLMPATYWTLERLGVLDKMKCSHFPNKVSVRFYTPDGRSAAPFYFDEVDDHESSHTWQVDRVEFDAMLLEHAKDSGVEVLEGVHVREVLFEDGRAIGVRADLGDDEPRRILAKVVVDASGQGSVLARQLDLRVIDDQLRHCAISARFQGAQRDEGRDSGATVIYWTRDKTSWFWFIPLPGDLSSVGAVGRIDQLLTDRTRDPQTVFEEELAACPALKERLRGAVQEEDATVAKDFSYLSKQIAGDGWVSAGDAFGFLDPIYSTGVFLALKSGELAADGIVEGLEKGDLSAEQLGKHGERYVEGMEDMRRLVYAYYDESFHFGRFLKQFPECREPLVNLLVGNIYRKPVGSLFESMSTMIDLPEPRRLESLGR